MKKQNCNNFLQLLTIQYFHLTALSPPTNLKVAKASATSVIVSWDPPTDTTGVTGYLIKYTEKGGSEQFSDVTGASTKMHKIPSLKTGSAYSVTIVATSKDLSSEEAGPQMVALGMRYIMGLQEQTMML